MKASFVGQKPEAKNISTFYFKPEKPVRYIAGQFTELHLPHPNKDERQEKRWFTLSSSPHEEFLAITTNFTSSGGSTFKRELENLRPGQEITMASPMGDFVLPKDPQVPLVFAAGGIGCTPFRSIVSWLNYKAQKRNITLLYAARAPENIAFAGIFKTLGDKFKIYLQEPSKNWQGFSGKLSADTILSQADITPEHYIYISGPEPMVETVAKDLKDSGVNKQHIYTDFFHGYLV